MTPKQPIVCHYEILNVPLQATPSDIKKAHRKLALQYHPDKNQGETLDAFRLVQQAYECLSDATERKWYDEHREAILQGWSGGISTPNMDILFDVVPFQHSTCYQGYGDDDEGFYHVYNTVFQKVFDGENSGWTSEGNINAMPLSFLSPTLGHADSEWSEVAAFYQSWESFRSCLAFAWADPYDVKEAPNRRIRRAMEDENKKARRNARRERNDNIEALVHFVKRRDPRIKTHRLKMEEETYVKERIQQEEAQRMKEQAKNAREVWKRNAELQMAKTQEEDRLAGRIRLADLDDEYDYNGGGKRGKGKNKKGKSVVPEPELQPEDYYWADSDNEEIDIPANDEIVETDGTIDVEGDELLQTNDKKERNESTEQVGTKVVWRCECCRKNFASEEMLKNHSKGRSHREARTKYLATQAEQRKQQAEVMQIQANDYLSHGGGKRKGKKKPNVTSHFVGHKTDASNVSIEMLTPEMSTGASERDKTGGNDTLSMSEAVEGATNAERQEPERPQVWRCEYCLKNFQSLGQFEHHSRGKKHQEAVKTHQAEQVEEKAKEMQALLDEQALELAEKIRLASLENYDLAGGFRKEKKRRDKGRFDGPEREQISSATQNNGNEASEGEQCAFNTNGIVQAADVRDDQPDTENEPLDESADEDSEISERDFWTCECCRKEFKSEGQMENHMKSKKHKESFRKYKAQQKTIAALERNALLDELVLDP